MSNEQLLKETTNHLREILATRNVMGAPVDFGEKVVIPVARYGFGFGAGGTHTRDAGSQGAGGGGGIDPVALIILHRDVMGAEGVQVMSLKKDSALAQAIAAVSETLAPQVIGAIKAFNEKGTAPEPEKREEL